MTFKSQRSVSALAVACLVLPGALIAGCGSGGGGAASSAPMASAPPVDDTRGGFRNQAPTMQRQTQAPQKQGMSGKTKVALLVGAAALYYMYNKNKQKRAASAEAARSEPQYYLSKNGRVYYREQNGQVHYVTPPTEGIQVPYSEAQQYSDFQGYNNSNSGRTLEDLVRSGGYSEPAQGGRRY